MTPPWNEHRFEAGPHLPSPSDVAALARYDARGAIGFRGADARLSTLRQQSPIRFLQPVPETGDPTTAVIVNTAGGVVGGDHLSLDLSVQDAASALITGQAAEKIYRSDGRDAEITASITCQTGARLEVLPQGTILFDGARLRRSTKLDVDPVSTLLFGEILYFGRVAMGETLRHGSIDDRIDLRQQGRRIWVDAFRLDGTLGQALQSRSGLHGAVASAMACLVCPGAGDHLADVRRILSRVKADGYQAAAAAFEGGPLTVRWLGTDGASLRRSFGAVWMTLRSAALGYPAGMPKIWSI